MYVCICINMQIFPNFVQAFAHLVCKSLFLICFSLDRADGSRETTGEERYKVDLEHPVVTGSNEGPKIKTWLSKKKKSHRNQLEEVGSKQIRDN